MIDFSDSNKFDINNHLNQSSANDCDTNMKSVKMDVSQTLFEDADFLSYLSFYDNLICARNIYSDEHEV